MAIWQFNIYFIPRQTLFDIYGEVLTELEYEEALSIPWWINLHVNVGNLLPLLQQFGELQEWTSEINGLRSFGDDETNDISVSYNKRTEMVDDLSCRLDLRKIDRDFIAKVFSIATHFDCLLMDCKGKLFQPLIEELSESIQLSSANRFVTDPRQFLEDMSNGKVAPE